jgi:serine/threonine-protein kinase
MPAPPIRSSPDQVIGRYALFREIASGGMASVHLGRLMGPAGFSRVVAIKRLHPHLARDPEFVKMFVDEARLAARVQHPNVVPTLDVVAENGEIFIVMEYVDGESLARLVRLSSETDQKMPVPVVVSIVLGALQGLHAAHEARNEEGRRIDLVHRDISPQNVLVGVDGLARVVDFGVAKAAGRSAQTSGGMLKGKLPYMSPEQIRLDPIDRRTDLYAVGVVMWEALAGRRLFSGGNDWDIAARIKAGIQEPPSAHNPEVSAALDAVVLRAAAPDADDRFATALDLADALEQAAPAAAGRAVGRFVESIAGESLVRRRQLVAEAESVRSDVAVLGQSIVTAIDTATTRRDDGSPVSSREKTQSTRLGGVFAQSTPSVPPPPSAPIHSRPSIPAFAPEEGMGTAAGWSTVVQRRLSAPMLGVIAGVVLAFAIGTIAVVARLASSDDAPAASAVPRVVEQPAVVASPAPAVPAPTPTEVIIEAPAEDVEEIPAEVARPKPIVVKPPEPAAPAPAPAPKPVKKPNCDPPYWVNKDGEKVFRRECLKNP